METLSIFEHRIRIKTEEKAKVVASVWGEEFIQILAALAILYWTIWIIKDELHQDDLKEKDEFILYAAKAQQGIE